MPRLSLWRPNHTNDYKFIDKNISEQFTVGGTDILIHKYLGPIDQGETGDATKPSNLDGKITNIQDLLFLENRDRKYDVDVYVLRGQYRVNDTDFDLSQFGLFLTADTIFMTVHLNDMVSTLGRKIIVGDVIELPHLKDYYPLDDQTTAALKRFYVVQDVNFGAEGFSQTWWPHLWRVKLQPLVDSQEYKDILNKIPAGDTNGDGVEDSNDNTLGDLLSTYNKYIDVNNAVIAQAEAEVPASGYDTSFIYHEPVAPITGRPADPTVLDASTVTEDASETLTDASFEQATSSGKVQGYLTGDGLMPNSNTVAAGISFPLMPSAGMYFLRLDYVPNRLFRYDGRRWVKIEDSVRTDLTPGPDNLTQRSQFVNNTNKTYLGMLAWDAIRVASPYIPLANAHTISFTLSNVSPYGTVVTKTPYVSTHGVKTKVNGHLINNTIANTAGNISFTVTNVLNVNDVLEYTIYSKVYEERQSLSDALRPTADN